MRFLLAGLPQSIAQAGGGVPVSPWVGLLAVLAVATMTLGNLSAINQTNMKRLLAYSSIAHAGYLLLGVCALDAEGTQAVMFYLFVYVLMNAGAFVLVNALEDAGGGTTVDDYKGLGKRAPLMAAMMTVFLLSLTGLPPLAGFAGKFLIFYALLARGGTLLTVIAVIGVLNSAISLYYYARVLRAMYLDAPVKTEAPTLSRIHVSMAVAMAVPTLLLGLYWAPLLAACKTGLQVWMPQIAKVAQSVTTVTASLR
jgi:NADH-quinone oxidoreductase subunit N